MRINRLEVRNFRAIRYTLLENLSDMVMIAGPNGCGKSCLLDAVRLLKSAYGGYQPNEWQQWLGEFQININSDITQLTSLFREREKEVEITIDFQLSTNESHFLRENAHNVLERLAWTKAIPGINDPYIQSRSGLAGDLRAHKAEVEQDVARMMPEFLAQLEKPFLRGALFIQPSTGISVETNVLLELIFSLYDPKNLGIIDYHGANRNYNREQVNGINLNLEQTEGQLKNHALYNYAQKYTNIKTEMAAGYIRDILSEKASPGSLNENGSIVETLKELFLTFFPGKKFLGPIPGADGTLSFPVRLPSGLQHDINELSSGEKEVVFGYLRLRNAAPRNSVILLDEPELHLNPALVRGLPQFYHRHLGQTLNNQIWLVTHSDAFLRESVGVLNFSVFHMQDAESPYTEENQMHLVNPGEELERAIMDLVGDLAAYRPGAKMVILEGEDSEFDLSLVSKLFPDFQKAVNLLSAGNKSRVNRLHALLDRATQKGGLPLHFYTVTDRDSNEGKNPTQHIRQFEWGVYHIENYLLKPSFILEVISDLTSVSDEIKKDESTVLSSLKTCAQESMPELVAHRVREEVNRQLILALELRCDTSQKNIPQEFARAISASKERIEKIIANDLTIAKLEKIEGDIRREFEASLENDEWLAKFRGRDVLKRFVGKHVSSLGYDNFRDLIITRMRDKQYQPAGIKLVIDAILSDDVKKRPSQLL